MESILIQVTLDFVDFYDWAKLWTHKKVPSAESRELARYLSFTPGLGQNIALPASLAAGN